MKKTVKLSMVALSMLLTTSCLTVKPEDVKLPEIQETNTNVGDYTQALQEVNNMVKFFHEKHINIIIQKIQDRTASAGALPSDISTIVKTSFNNIGTNVVTMFSFDMKNLPKNKVFIISGAITEFDLIQESGGGTKVSGQGTHLGQQAVVEGGMDDNSKITKLAINFNPSNAKTGIYVPRASTSNKITVNQESKANEFAFSILGSGIGIDSAVTKSQGFHASLKTLVELSVVEVLGKLTNYPYWLLTGGNVNSDILANLSASFLSNSLNKKIEKISYLLSIRKGSIIQPTTIMNSKLKDEIIKYKKSKGLRVDDTISRQLYMSLLGV